VVTLINDNGVTKAPFSAPVIDPAGQRIATITYTGPGTIAGAENWMNDTSVPFDGHSVSITQPPCGVAVIEMTPT
jgi:hypothetical protein